MYLQENDSIQLLRNTFYEELANTTTHGIGTILAAIGLGVMTVLAAIYGDVWHITSVTIFGATLVILYAISTLYHNAQRPKVKALLQIMDHSAIYLLIAGTYTPFTLVNLRGPWGWSLFGVVWGLAVFGIFLEVFAGKKWRLLSIILYLIMGWLVVVAVKPLVDELKLGGFILLSSGGLFYTLGILFYAWKSLPYNHAVWHLFVLTGSILHCFAVIFYVIPV